jgi:biopolymer transport protein ExbD
MGSYSYINKGESKKAKIVIIPMIDIMLFLVVFFALIMLRMIPSSGIASQIPHASAVQEMSHPKVLISLFKNGTIKVKGKVLTLNELVSLLRNHNPKKTVVTIAGSKKVSLQHLVSVMSACKKKGVSKIGIAASRS